MKFTVETARKKYIFYIFKLFICVFIYFLWQEWTSIDLVNFSEQIKSKLVAWSDVSEPGHISVTEKCVLLDQECPWATTVVGYWLWWDVDRQ